MEERRNGKESEKEKGEATDKRWIGDVVRDLTATGLAALFMTEDSIRGLLKEKNIPKDLVSLVLDSLSKRKDDLYGVVAKEFGRVLSKVDLTAEVASFLETHKVHVSATLSFEAKPGKGKDEA